MKTFYEMLRIIESYNKDILNNLLKRIQERKKGENFIFEKEEVKEVENVVNMAKQKWLALMNGKYSKEFKQYLDWEKNTVIMSFSNGVYAEKLQPSIKIEPNFSFSNNEAFVNQEFYNLLIWRKVIKGLDEVIEGKDPHKYIVSGNGANVRVVEIGLKKLAQFIK